MLRSSLALALLPVLAISSLACARNVFSPPALPLPLEAPRTLDNGQAAIQASGGTSSSMFGPDLVAGAATVHVGMGRGTEASLGASVTHLQGHSSAGTSPDIISARAGVKKELWRHHVSAIAGLGGGTDAGGGFVSPDVGVIAGFDNRYAVPFLSLHAMSSIPVGARQVDVSIDDEQPGTYVGTPKPTWGIGSTVGLRVPIGNPDSKGVHAGLTGGMTFWKLYSDGHDIGFTGLGGSADVIF